jgi:hypothetical protein
MKIKLATTEDIGRKYEEVNKRLGFFERIKKKGLKRRKLKGIDFRISQKEVIG